MLRGLKSNKSSIKKNGNEEDLFEFLILVVVINIGVEWKLQEDLLILTSAIVVAVTSISWNKFYK